MDSIHLNQSQIDEFKRIWLQEFGEEISDAEAIKHGTKLIELIKAIYKSPTNDHNAEKKTSQS